MYRQQSYLAHAAKHAQGLANQMIVIGRDRATPGALDWRADVAAAYQESLENERPLALALAARVYTLTGRVVTPESVFVDYEAGMAVAVVDGVTFRMRRGEVVILRACQECGLGYIESPPLATRADLGYALTAWEPRCAGCEEEDPANWLES